MTRITLRADTRGQAYITEAILAAVLLSALLITASSTLGVAEQRLSVEEKQQQNELQSEITNVVEVTGENGEMKSSLLNWNASNRRYNDYETVQTAEGYYLNYPNDEFGSRLQGVATRTNASLAVEIVPTNTPFKSQSSELQDVEPNGKTVISRDATTDTVIVKETYMTVYANDRLQASPEAYTTTLTPSTADTSLTTVKEAYTNEKTKAETGGNDVDEVYFPFVPKQQNYDDIDNGEVWNTYRVRVIAWF